MKIKALTGIVTTVCLIMGVVAIGTSARAEQDTTNEIIIDFSTDIVEAGLTENAEAITAAARAIKTEKEEAKKPKEMATEEPKKAPVTTGGQVAEKKAENAIPANNANVERAEAAVAGTSGAARIIALSNVERVKTGAGMVRCDATLTAMAQQRALEITKKWSHEREDGTNVGALAEEYGLQYTKLAENLAKGQATEERAIEMWLASAGHRRNLLNPIYTRTGAAIAEYNGLIYRVQLFAK